MAPLPRINVAPVPRPLVFRTMGRRHRKLSSCYTFGRLYSTRQKLCSCYILRLRSARALRARAHLVPHVTILNSHFLGGAKLQLECNTAKHVKKEQRLVNSELKGRNTGIVEKVQETRFGLSPKYSRYSYIGIAS